MKKFPYMFLCVILLLASSCNKDDKPSGNIAKTGDATAVTAFTAKISGYCYQKNIEGLSVTFGIEYTDSDLTRNAIVLYASEFDGNSLFSVDIENLNPGTESNMMKYNSRDNKKRLMSDDDVASQELGGLWRRMNLTGSPISPVINNEMNVAYLSFIKNELQIKY